MLRRSLILTLLLTLAMGMGVAWAAPIGPGFDFFATPPGGGILPRINLFDQIIGPTPLVGKPIDPMKLGTTDTIVQRKTGLGDLQTGRIDAEIVALSLRSIAPVFVREFESFFDVFVTLDNRPGIDRPGKLRPSTGFLDIKTHDSGGGTFDSFFDVFTKVVFAEVGGPERFELFSPDSDPISSMGTEWSHTEPSFPVEGTEFTLPNGDPIVNYGNFGVGPINHTGPHPRVVPPERIPEPSALLLLGAGLAGVGAVAWRRRRQ